MTAKWYAQYHDPEQSVITGNVYQEMWPQSRTGTHIIDHAK